MGVDNGNSVAEINEVSGALQGVDEQMVETSTGAEKLAQSLEFGSAVAGGIAAVQGAMGLLGIENEKAMKTISRLMQLQAIAGGLQQGANLLLKENIVITKLKTAAQLVYNGVLKSTILTTAVLTGGITLLIGGIGWLVSSMNDSTDAVDENTNAVDENVESVKNAADEYSNYTKILNENADAVERVDMVNGQFQKTQTVGIAALEREIKLMKARGDSQIRIFQKEKEIIDERIRLLDDQMLTETNHVEFIRKIKDLETQKQIIDIEILKERNIEDFEQRKQREIEQSRELLGIIGNRSSKIKEIDNSENLAKINNAKIMSSQINEINDQMDAENEKRHQKELERVRVENQMKRDLATITTGALLDLSSLLVNDGEKQAELQKALTVTQIAIDTASGISSAVRDGMKVGITPIEKGIAIASGIAVVLTNMAKAKSVLNGGSISGADDSRTRTNGNSNLLGQLAVSQGGDGGFNPNPTGGFGRSGESNGSSGRVFVVDTDITKQQKQTEFVNVVSTF